MTNEDWHVVLHALRDGGGVLGLLFILTFYLAFNVCLLSLMTALTINTFLGAKAELLQQGVLVDASEHANDDDAGHAHDNASFGRSSRARPPHSSHAHCGAGAPGANGRGAGMGASSGVGGFASCAVTPGAYQPRRRSSSFMYAERVAASEEAIDDEVRAERWSHSELRMSDDNAQQHATMLQIQAAEKMMRQHEGAPSRPLPSRPPTCSVLGAAAAGAGAPMGLAEPQKGACVGASADHPVEPRLSFPQQAAQAESARRNLIARDAPRSHEERPAPTPSRSSTSPRRAANGRAAAGTHSSEAPRPSPPPPPPSESAAPKLTPSPMHLLGPPSRFRSMDYVVLPGDEPRDSAGGGGGGGGRGGRGGGGGGVACRVGDDGGGAAAAAAAAGSGSARAKSAPTPPPRGEGQPSESDVREELANTRWRVAGQRVSDFTRRSAAGLASSSEEPLDHEEAQAIARLTRASDAWRESITRASQQLSPPQTPKGDDEATEPRRMSGGMWQA